MSAPTPQGQPPMPPAEAAGPSEPVVTMPVFEMPTIVNPVTPGMPVPTVAPGVPAVPGMPPPQPAGPGFYPPALPGGGGQATVTVTVGNNPAPPQQIGSPPVQ